MTERNVKLTIAYDGSAYHGWQRQAGGIVTVQEELERAIPRVVGHPVSLRAAGRTDTGVHAAGQVANFRTDTRVPDERLAHAINSRISETVRIVSSERVADDFDATLSAKSKLYRYKVWTGPHRPPELRLYSWHWWRGCDVELVRAGAAYLMGRQDFASFASAGSERKTTVRNVMRCEVMQEGDWLWFDVEADGFLYHMVRNIVGTLVEVGRGHWRPEYLAEILAAKDRSAAGPMAPAQGLWLMWVAY